MTVSPPASPGWVLSSSAQTAVIHSISSRVLCHAILAVFWPPPPSILHPWRFILNIQTGAWMASQ
jgi:hypothetical protein